MFEFRRQHPVAAITQLLAVLRQNVVTIVILLVVGSRNTGEYFWYFFGLGIVSALVLGVVGWFRFYYRIVEDELEIKKGIFVRKNLFLSKDRIQVINITEGFIQRLFGLVKVEVKTAGSGTENATINAISRREAEELRRLLRSEPIVTSNNDEPHAVAERDEEVKKNYPFRQVSNKELFIAALTSGNFGVIASILGAVSGQLNDLINEENIKYVMDHVPIIDVGSVWLGFLILIFIVSYTLSFTGVILRFYNFRVEKREKELHITSGLLERKQITVPFNRIQAVRFVEGILRQPFGYGMIYLESAGFEEKDQHKSLVMHPLIRKDEMLDFLGTFIEDYVEPAEVIKPPKKSLIRYIRRPNYLILLAAPILWWFWSYGWLLFLLTIPLGLYGWIRYRDAEFAYDDKIMTMKFRVLAKTTAYIQRKRVQVAEVTTNPFQKPKGLSSMSVTAASGAGGKEFSIIDIDKEEALKVLTWTADKEFKRI